MACHSECTRKRIIKLRGNKCEKCGYKGYIEHHHIVRIIDGGTNQNENILLLCEKCHAEAHGYIKKKYMDEFREGWQSNG